MEALETNEEYNKKGKPMKTFEELREKGPGLWANIHAKRKRGEKMRKKGEKGAPSPEALAKAQAASENIKEAEYQGRKVTLNKPVNTGTDEPGKSKVFVKDPSTGNVKMVRFGHQGGGVNKDSKTLTIKKKNPARRKSFRARHNCDNPGPKTKARYWSCKAW